MTINLLPVKDQICIYCEKYYQRAWMPGLSGGLAMLSQPTPTTKSIVFTPDNVSKGELKSGDLFEFKWVYDKQSFIPPVFSRDNEPHIPTKNLQLYMTVLTKSERGVVVEVCSSWFALASRTALKLWEKNGNNYPNRFRIAHWGLLEKLNGSPINEIFIPIIEKNISLEELNFSLENNIKYAQHNCILIRNYSAIVWDSNLSLLTQRLELLEELFKLQIKDFC